MNDAKRLVRKLQFKLQQQHNRKWQAAFTALADGDEAIGLLAFYLWRRHSAGGGRARESRPEHLRAQGLHSHA